MDTSYSECLMFPIRKGKNAVLRAGGFLFISKFILVMVGRFKDNPFIEEAEVKKKLQDCSELIKNEIRHMCFSNPPG